MNLIELILSIFHVRWNEKLFVNAYQDYRKFSSFINEVFQKMYIINEIQLVYGEHLKFALWATNSSNYIATVIALILKNVDFYLIPPKMSVTEVTAIVANSDINVLFTSTNVLEYKISNKLQVYPCYKLSYNIEDNTIHYTKSKTLKDTLNNESINSTRLIIKNSSYEVTDLEEIVIKDFKLKKRQRDIVVFSSGTDSLYPRGIYFSDEKIANAILILSDSELLPNLNSKSVYADIDFANAFVWSILWPLYSGALFAFNPNEANIILTDNNSFEYTWVKISKKIYETRIVGKWLFKNWLDWLFRIIARCKLKRYFNSSIKKDAIIILNAFLPSRIMKTIVGHLPLYTTYGMQETNQILAVNNYSSFKHSENNCVGEPLAGVHVSLRENNFYKGEGSIIIATELLSEFTGVEKSYYYDTRDHGSLDSYKDKTLLFVYGKSKYAIYNETNSNFENIERILKNIPYVKDALFYENEGDKHIIVFPNVEIVEAANFDLIDFKNFIKSYKSYINSIYGSYFIKDVKLIFDDFVRTHTGKIKKVLYLLADDIENDL